LDLILDFSYVSFSNCNIKPNPTHLPKNQTLSPNHQFSQRILYVECCSVHARYGVKSEISLDTGGSQARRQDLAAVGSKTRRRGHEPEGEATFLIYSIGCMQQPVGQT